MDYICNRQSKKGASAGRGRRYLAAEWVSARAGMTGRGWGVGIASFDFAQDERGGECGTAPQGVCQIRIAEDVWDLAAKLTPFTANQISNTPCRATRIWVDSAFKPEF